jgi:hypothetical protein
MEFSSLGWGGNTSNLERYSKTKSKEFNFDRIPISPYLK